jgi:predicted nucleic acid-binding protein
MADTLIDSNVLLDIATNDQTWADWSHDAVERCAEEGLLHINPIVYAEVSLAFDTIEALERALPSALFSRSALPWEAGFLAGRCSRSYRHRGGERRSPLADFYIGAHAAVSGMTLLTRDSTRYRTYFPQLRIVAPPDARRP